MALDTTPLDRADLTTRYLIANTPSFLFGAYRKLGYVQSFATSNATDVLIQVIEDIDAAERRSAADIALAYAATVALTFHDPASVRAWLRDVDLQNLLWPQRMLEQWLSSLVASTVTTADAGKAILLDQSGLTVSRSSATTLIWTPPQ